MQSKRQPPNFKQLLTKSEYRDVISLYVGCLNWLLGLRKSMSLKKVEILQVGLILQVA